MKKIKTGWGDNHWQWRCSLPSKGCGCPYDSFWKTVTESPQWEKWRSGPGFEKRFDVEECRYFGWISQKHFQAFLKFCASLKREK